MADLLALSLPIRPFHIFMNDIEMALNADFLLPLFWP